MCERVKERARAREREIRCAREKQREKEITCEEEATVRERGAREKPGMCARERDDNERNQACTRERKREYEKKRQPVCDRTYHV